MDVPFTVTNTNDYDVTLSKAELKTVAVDAAHSACATSVVTGSDVTLSDVVATGATSSSQDFTLTMSNAATDDCQGAVFTVTLGVTGLSS